MPVVGFVPLRRHLFGRQAAFGDAAPGTRAYPFSGFPSMNLNWTEAEGDFGSIDPIAPPTLGIPDLTASLTAPTLNYNDLPLMLAGVLGANVTPSGAGASKTWAFAPTSLTPDTTDAFTYEFGDDVETDWDQLSDGRINDLTINSPDDGVGKLDASMTWKFGTAASTGSTDFPADVWVPGAALPDSQAIPVYLKDASVYINSTAATIGDTQLTDAVHNFSLHITQEEDEKRYVNGSQSFALNDIGRGKRAIEMTIQYAKVDTVTVGLGSEADAWFSSTAVDRFLSIEFESLEKASTGPDVFYSWIIRMPMRYFTREDTSIGNNATVTLTAHAFYEPDTLTYAFRSTVVNTLADVDFES